MSKAMEAAARAIAALGPDGMKTRVSNAREEAQAAVTAYLAAREAEGWVMVPVEPSDDMAFAGWDKIYEDSAPEDIYAAMLAARPTEG